MPSHYQQEREPESLASATTRARQLAVATGKRHYVHETDIQPLSDAVASSKLPPYRAWFGVADGAALAQLIRATEHDGEDHQLAILRVAYPDGRVESVTDPGNEAGRLAAFCQD
jgi:hypothetical protein